MKRLVLLWLAATFFAAPGLLWGQSPEEEFQKSCAMCHTIGGGPLVGPDLAGMSEHRERAWLIRFIVDPQAVIDSGDPVAKEMVEQHNGMIMPTTPGMTPELAAALIDYVASKSGSGAEESEAAPPAAAEEPFTAEDIETGRRLFRGDIKLDAGGAACLSCHDVSGVAWLGGGSLGPSLTGVYNRLGERKGLAAWLSSPPTPSMSALYREHPLSEQEVHALTAFFADRATQPTESSEGGWLQLFLLGLAGAAVSLLAFARIWRNRFRGVRRRMVHGPQTRGVQ